jgi:hypothetical protein
MLRTLMAGLLALVSAACSYGSDIDLAPMNERIPKRILVTGDYCEASASQPPYTVKSSADCIRLEWSQSSRTYTIRDLDDDDEPAVAAVVSLGRDLYLAQVADLDDETNGRYKVSLVIAKGGAFLYLPRLGEDRLSELLERHPGVALRTDGSDPVIAGGSRTDIKAFLRDSATETLRSVNDDDLSIAIRDTQGAPDHIASASQARSIADLVAALRTLQPAP